MNRSKLGAFTGSRWAGRGTTVALAALSLGWCSAPLGVVRAAAAPQGQQPGQTQNQDWAAYGGHSAQDHYSSLAQINRENVKNLKVAWTYDTGEVGSMETTPVIVGHVLYTYTPSLKVVALDAVTGKLLWTFDSGAR